MRNPHSRALRCLFGRGGSFRVGEAHWRALHITYNARRCESLSARWTGLTAAARRRASRDARAVRDGRRESRPCAHVDGTHICYVRCVFGTRVYREDSYTYRTEECFFDVCSEPGTRTPAACSDVDPQESLRYIASSKDTLLRMPALRRRSCSLTREVPKLLVISSIRQVRLVVGLLKQNGGRRGQKRNFSQAPNYRL